MLKRIWELTKMEILLKMLTTNYYEHLIITKVVEKINIFLPCLPAGYRRFRGKKRG
jgi:hypothetical protein